MHLKIQIVDDAICEPLCVMEEESARRLRLAYA